MYPDMKDYVKAITQAKNRLNTLLFEPVFKQETNGAKQLIRFSGGFSIVFKVKDVNGRYYAIKCFTKKIPERFSRYQIISNYIHDHNKSSSYFVRYEYIENELFVLSSYSKENWYPVLKMDWVEGKTLGEIIKISCKKNDIIALKHIRDNWNHLCLYLLKHNIAHGDLKHDNIIVTKENALVLIDYDGLYVPELQNTKALEYGSKNYQHPNRKISNYDENIDHFSMLIIKLSLCVLILKPSLFKFNTRENIIFTKSDFINFDDSELIDNIKSINDPYLNRLIKELKQSCLSEDISIPNISNILKKNSSTICINYLNYTIFFIAILFVIACSYYILTGNKTENQHIAENNELDNTLSVIEDNHRIKEDKQIALPKSEKNNINQYFCQSENGVNLREKPDLNSKVVAVIKPKEIVRIINRIDCNHRDCFPFYKVLYQDKIMGWATPGKDYDWFIPVYENNILINVSEVEKKAVSTQITKRNNDNSINQYICLSDSGVNLRERPDVNSKIIAVIESQDIIKVINKADCVSSDCFPFYNVVYKDKIKGWASPGKNYEWLSPLYKTKQGDNDISITVFKAEYSPLDKNKIDQNENVYICQSDSGVNLREKPDIRSNKLAQIAYNDMIRVIDIINCGIDDDCFPFFKIVYKEQIKGWTTPGKNYEWFLPVCEDDIEKIKKTIIGTVYNWAEMWSNMNIDKYLQFYSPNFSPENNINTIEWIENRKKNLKKKYIKITIQNYRIYFESCNKARAYFDQKYISNNFKSSCRKLLIFELFNNNWLIIKEKAIMK